MQRRDAAALRLDLSNLRCADPAQARHTIGLRSRLKVGQPWQLVPGDGHDQFPAALKRDRVLLAEFVHQLGALDAELSLERARRIVDARVDDAGIVAGLVLGYRAGLVDDDDLSGRAPGDYFARDGESDDPGADHGDVIAVWSHPDILLLARCGSSGRSVA